MRTLTARRSPLVRPRFVMKNASSRLFPPTFRVATDCPTEEQQARRRSQGRLFRSAPLLSPRPFASLYHASSLNTFGLLSTSSQSKTSSRTSSLIHCRRAPASPSSLLAAFALR